MCSEKERALFFFCFWRAFTGINFYDFLVYIFPIGTQQVHYAQTVTDIAQVFLAAQRNRLFLIPFIYPPCNIRLAVRPHTLFPQFPVSCHTLLQILKQCQGKGFHFLKGHSGNGSFSGIVQASAYSIPAPAHSVRSRSDNGYRACTFLVALSHTCKRLYHGHMDNRPNIVFQRGPFHPFMSFFLPAYIQRGICGWRCQCLCAFPVYGRICEIHIHDRRRRQLPQDSCFFLPCLGGKFRTQAIDHAV